MGEEKGVRVAGDEEMTARLQDGAGQEVEINSLEPILAERESGVGANK